jgi:hypothetical protein
MPGGASMRLISFTRNQYREIGGRSIEGKKMAAPKLPATTLVQRENEVENTTKCVILIEDIDFSLDISNLAKMILTKWIL